MRRALRVVFLCAGLLPSAWGTAQSQQASGDGPTLAQLWETIKETLPSLRLPAVDQVVAGGRRIERGERIDGSLATHGGDLDVSGEVAGDAIAVDGNVVVRAGGRILGDAVAVRGRIINEGGTIAGGRVVLAGDLTLVPIVAPRPSPAQQTKRALSLAFTTFAILAFIGIGVLIFAGSQLDGVVESLQGHFARSLLVGVAGQLALAPALVILLIALALTVVGLLLIPFAIVAFALAAAGIATLGFLAIAHMTGSSLFGSRAGATRTERGVKLRGLVLGIVVFAALWTIAAAFTWLPTAAAVLRVLALIITWVAVTAGFGAAITSRAGARRAVAAPLQISSLPPEEPAWQTPTPVTGVAAARRPSVTPRVGESR